MTDHDEKTHEIKDKFWHELAESPFVMLQLDNDPDSAAPMTAQLDKDANHAIWFFTSRDNHFAKMGLATVTFSSKGHDIFARFHGMLTEETSKERLDKEWSNAVEAWFPGGKDDPNLLMLRMDLGKASIWHADLGLGNVVKMLLGKNVRDDVKDKHVETAL
ncbi:pyridoxamine 5'-phosphate oxidase family protein [Croceicoccus mobilis]|uniref:General stress protein n=1 Tax=Croceicoccus mobilis TaxID=1703339 RepID=A0A916YVH2_9SPHN|nr:pyridoxamine 5'-phosphate oxidase family protein [Croceicoccus mobilis]GGD62970.1 general stress protein [Croceicoccus mobilis]